MRKSESDFINAMMYAASPMWAILNKQKGKPMNYYTKDGVKIEVGMEVNTPGYNKSKIIFIHDGEEIDNILLETEDQGLMLWAPEDLTSIKMYNGYGLRLSHSGYGPVGASPRETILLEKKRKAFDKLISHPGCRPFVSGLKNFYMDCNRMDDKVDWRSACKFQESPLCYDKIYPELEETFKEFLGV